MWCFSSRQSELHPLEGREIRVILWIANLCAGVAELVDAPDLGSGAERREGSSPFTRTTFQI